MHLVTTNVNECSNVVEPTVLLDIEIEGVPIEGILDTGSPSTIISRDVQHAVGRSLQQGGHPLPEPCKPVVKLYGKDVQKNGQELVVTAIIRGVHMG